MADFNARMEEIASDKRLGYAVAWKSAGSDEWYLSSTIIHGGPEEAEWERDLQAGEARERKRAETWQAVELVPVPDTETSTVPGGDL